jgi:squalene synthase HpnC
MMRAVPLELAPPVGPSAKAVMDRASGENFPVAMRVLARAERRRLLAVYGFARLADELGDDHLIASTERLAALDWLEHELNRAYAGEARHPLLVRLQATLAECALPRGPFVRLVEANRLDQRVARYETWEQLRAYCELSANPVGELVLGVFGLATPERVALSNEVCTALQLAEHLQDVGEDLVHGRVYLPEADLERFGCSRDQLAGLGARAGLDLDLRGVPADSTTPGEDSGRAADRLRAVISFEVARARELLAAGVPLVAGVGGRPKLAVAAFVAGGRAALEEIAGARFDVLGGVPQAGRARRLRALARVLGESRARAGGGSRAGVEAR